MNLAEIRKKYPEYNDLSDKQLAEGLHKNFYSDMPFDEFAKGIGYVEPKKREENTPWYDSGWVRKPLAVAQGTLNSNLNPIGFIAKGSNYVFGNGKWELPESLRPIEPKDTTEKVLMNSAKVANDLYSTYAIGTGLGNVGLLGQGVSKGSKIANAVLNPSNPSTLSYMAAQGNALADYVDPESGLARFGLEMFGAAPVQTSKLALKVGGKAIGGIGSLARKGMALASGVSDDALKQAYNIGKSGNKAAQKAFKSSLRGDTSITQVVDDAEDALRKIQENASSKYAPLKEKLFNDPRKLDITPIQNKANELANSMYDRGVLIGDKKTAGYLNEMVDAVNRHSPHNDIRGLDSMRRSVQSIEIPLENKIARRVQKALSDKIKDTIIKQSPEYKQLVGDYANSQETIKGIRDALHVGGQNRSTTARSIMQAVRDNVNANFGAKANALRVLEEQGGKELTAALVGQELSPWLPKGLQRGVASAGLFGLGARSGSTPLLFGVSAMSPRIDANVVNTVGKAVSKLPTINVNPEKVKDALKAIGISEVIDRLIRKENK